MDNNFQKILTITGLPGLYQLKSHNNNGFIVTSLVDNQSRFVANAKQKVLALGNIDLVTYSSSISLVDVIGRILTHEPNVTSSSAEESDQIQFFRNVLPDYDEKKVFPSTIKKVLQWYEILKNSEFDLNAAFNRKDTNLGIDD